MLGRFAVTPAGVDNQTAMSLDQVVVEAVVVGGEQDAVGGCEYLSGQSNGFQVSSLPRFPAGYPPRLNRNLT